MSSSSPGRPVEIFFSYTHADEELRDELDRHLAPLKRDQTLSTWHDRKIHAGEDWQGLIDQRLMSADVVLLLVSSDFLASDFCHYGMARALDRHHAGEAIVIPILLRACHWQRDLGALQALPKNCRPIVSWPDRDAAFVAVVDGVVAVVDEVARRLADRQLNVSLPSELSEFVTETVASGRYLSESEVVREGLRLLEERELLHRVGFKEARERVAAGLASLDRRQGINGEQLFARIEARLSDLERKRAEK